MLFFLALLGVLCVVARQADWAAKVNMTLQYHSIVVPAKAGTHTPWALKWKMEPTPCDKNCRLWLWVPAFAGTTSEAFRRDDVEGNS
jgi:hypothetical protein